MNSENFTCVWTLRSDEIIYYSHYSNWKTTIWYWLYLYSLYLRVEITDPSKKARSRRTNSLGKVQTASDSNLKEHQPVDPKNPAKVNKPPAEPLNRQPLKQEPNNRQVQNQTNPRSNNVVNGKQNQTNTRPVQNQSKPISQMQQPKSLSQESSIGITNSKPPSQQPNQQKMEIGSSIGKSDLLFLW